jgi:hypothetical protein
MIEWYDFYIFGSLATIIAPLFYPQGNNTLALIAYLSTFAVGFVVRPFGRSFLAASAIWSGVSTLSGYASDYGRAYGAHRFSSDVREHRRRRADYSAGHSRASGLALGASTVAQRFTLPSTCRTSGAASSPASYKLRRRWVCLFRSSLF